MRVPQSFSSQDGAGWPGVLMGNLFSRPHATALFIVDGVSTGTATHLALVVCIFVAVTLNPSLIF